MIDKRIAVYGVLGGVGLGLASMAFPSATSTVQAFTEGLLGIPEKASSEPGEVVELRADFAASTLNRELGIEEHEELFWASVHHLRGRYQKAVPILGKYAMLGDRSAQLEIGVMYYFGQGLPRDREEGIRWLQLAAAQGGQSDRQTLAAAMDGTLEWEQSSVEPEYAYDGNAQTSPPFDPGSLPRSRSTENSAYGAGGASGAESKVPGSSGYGPVKRSIDEAYGSAPASRRYSEAEVRQPQVESAPPVNLTRVGPDTYTDANGNIYAQAGPNGVVNTRSGEFRPTN